MHIHHKEHYTLPNPRTKPETASPRPIVDMHEQTNHNGYIQADPDHQIDLHAIQVQDINNNAQ